MEDKKPKSEAYLRHKKADQAKFKKHQKEVEKQMDILFKQFGNRR